MLPLLKFPLRSLFGLIAIPLYFIRAAPSAGCGSNLPAGLTPGGSSQFRFMQLANGTQRTYKIYIPTQYNQLVPAPLIISYHGRGENGATQEARVMLSQSSYNMNYIVAYPDGITAQWQGDPAAIGYNDTGFTHELLNLLESTYCIDTSRVLGNGFSNGAGFTGNILPCDPWGSTAFAAFGIGSSAAYIQSTLNLNTNCTTNGFTPDIVPIACNPAKVLPMLEFHGLADTTIAYTGGLRRSSCLPSIPHLMTNWASLDSLGTTNISSTITANGQTAYYYQYGSGQALGETSHYAIVGMGHVWPVIGNAPFQASTILISWFNQWAPSDNIPFNGTQYSMTRASSTVSATQTTEGSFPTSTQSIACPANDGSIYTTTYGKQYLIQCYHDYNAYDLANGNYGNGNMASCMEACALYVGCLAASFTGGTCYMKTQWTQGFTNNTAVTGGIFYGTASTSIPSFSASSSMTISTLSGPASSTAITSSSGSPNTPVATSSSAPMTSSSASPSTSAPGSSSLSTTSSSASPSPSAPGSSSMSTMSNYASPSISVPGSSFVSITSSSASSSTSSSRPSSAVMMSSSSSPSTATSTSSSAVVSSSLITSGSLLMSTIVTGSSIQTPSSIGVSSTWPSSMIPSSSAVTYVATNSATSSSSMTSAVTTSSVAISSVTVSSVMSSVTMSSLAISSSAISPSAISLSATSPSAIRSSTTSPVSTSSLATSSLATSSLATSSLATSSLATSSSATSSSATSSSATSSLMASSLMASSLMTSSLITSSLTTNSLTTSSSTATSLTTSSSASIPTALSSVAPSSMTVSMSTSLTTSSATTSFMTSTAMANSVSSSTIMIFPGTLSTATTSTVPSVASSTSMAVLSSSIPISSSTAQSSFASDSLQTSSIILTSTTIISSSTFQVSLTTSSASTRTTLPSAVNPLCPTDDNDIYLSNQGTSYDIMCGFNITGPVAYPYIMNVGSFSKCMRYCDQHAGCEAVAYLKDCHLVSQPTDYEEFGSKDESVVRVAVQDSVHLQGAVQTSSVGGT